MRYLSSRIALLATLAGAVCAAQNAQGFIKIGSDRRELKFARAAEIVDDLDKSKSMTHIVLSEAEIPSKALFDGGALFDIRADRKNQIVELNFRENSVNWFLTGKEMEGTLSMSRSPNPFPYAVMAGAIKGTVAAHSEPGDKDAWEIDVTFTAPLEHPVVEAAPTPADAIAAQKHPAVKAYLDLHDAVIKGDKARILAAVPDEYKAQIDTPDFPKVLKMIQAMQAQRVKVLKVVESEGVATLTMTGVMSGKPGKGEATLALTNGKWLVRSENWRD